MSDFEIAPGFEDVWRPPVRPGRRTPKTGLAPSPAVTRARLARIVHRAPEVMVKVTGRVRDGGHLKAHLDYISRNGDLPLEGRDGAALEVRRDLRELAEDWITLAELCRRRSDAPISLSLVLSMPRETEAVVVRDAARTFAQAVFGDRFDYVLALHTDTSHPHIHVAVACQGADGARLAPKKADLDHWRQVFAQALRDRGVDAEATPRRARGVALKAERTPIRKMRERHAAGRGPLPMALGEASRAAAAAASGPVTPTAWERRIVRRQAQIRTAYLAQARLLQGSPHPEDRRLGDAVEAFLRTLPAPLTRRIALARALRAANQPLQSEHDAERRRGPER